MADQARLAAAGLFLSLTLAAIPALLPLTLPGANAGQPVHAAGSLRPVPRAASVAPAAASPPAPPAAIVHLQGGTLAALEPGAENAGDAAAELEAGPSGNGASAPDGVLQLAIEEAAPRSHTVAAGETLWKISQDRGVGVEALAAANHLTLGAILHPGQVLVMPPVDPAAPPAEEVTAGAQEVPAGTHRVAQGETLWAISHRAHVGVEALAAANHLASNAVLRPGQRLVVPPPGTPPPVIAVPLRPRPAAKSPVPAIRIAARFQPLVGIAGFLGQPSEGMITSRFGWRIHPIFGTREFHTGVDIANRMGTPIRAAAAGIVKFVGWMGGYGRLVVVAHGNGFETSYSHLSEMLVTLGQRVGRGQVLGRMGSTGWSTGPHLFFEVRRHGVALDPLPYLQGRLAVADAGPAPNRRPAPHPAVPVKRGAPSPPQEEPAARPAAPAPAPGAVPAPGAAPAPAAPPPAAAPAGGQGLASAPAPSAATAGPASPSGEEHPEAGGETSPAAGAP
jgi:murein DD-endopeptidase MepM/ murein hydrolase activator NlpD